jgi:hypothetical protein
VIGDERETVRRFRHPEAAAKRPSKGDGAFGAHLRMTGNKDGAARHCEEQSDEAI